jgi:hypothetical protein
MGHEKTISYIKVALRVSRMHHRGMPAHHPPARISQHAIDRYRRHVELVDAATAWGRLAEMAAASTRRPTPRQWTVVAPALGVLFLCPHDRSDVGLLMKDDTIVTVFSWVICLEWRARQPDGHLRRVRRPPYRRHSPGSWPLEAA